MPSQIASLIDTSILGGLAFAIGIAGVGLWLAAAWWTYGDMARRTSSDLARFGAAAWIILSTPALLLMSLPVYLLARPQATAAQRRSRELVVALSPELFGAVRCEACGEVVDDEWRRCPSCTTWLQVACVDCGRWSATNLELCPWCATSRAFEVAPPVEEAEEAEEGDVAAAYALEPDAVDAGPVDAGPVDVPAMVAGPAAPVPVFSFLPQLPVLAAALVEASPSPLPNPALQASVETPGPRELRRSRGRGRGFEAPVDEAPAAIAR